MLKNLSKSTILSLFLIFAFAGISLAVDEITVQSLQDTTVRESRPNENFDTHQYLGTGVQTQNNGRNNYAFILFNVEALPAEIISAKIKLVSSLGNGQDDSGVLLAHQVIENWDENTVTWSTKPQYNAEIIDSVPFNNQMDVEVVVDITELYKQWKTGAPNYGVMFNTEGSDTAGYCGGNDEWNCRPGEFYSSANTSVTDEYKPQLIIQTGTASENVFCEFQSIPTLGAFDWESFIINGDNYLAIANLRADPLGEVDSKIYKWNGTLFEEVQSISMAPPKHFHSFQIDGETYLAVANNQSAYGNRNINSKIYKWNGTSFVEYQSIPTNGAYNWESFIINGETYLAVANNTTGSGVHDIHSKIYKWNGSAFIEYQSILTYGALDWEYFTIEGESYLALANNYALGTYFLDSKIYRWNGSSFVEFQLIPTMAGHEWRYFTIDGESYLAVANQYNGTFYVDSKIYKWNGFSFVEYQPIPTVGAFDLETFQVGANTYLAIANNYTGTTYNQDSKIYMWNGNLFEEVQAIPTHSAHDWESFSIEGQTYLAVANYTNGTTRVIDSEIYKFCGNEPPNPTIIAVDGGKAIWNSNDFGVSWTEVNPEFDNTTPKAIVSDSNGNLYILTALSEIVMSEDGGLTWAIVNSDYNGGEVKSDWVAMACSKSNGYLYIIEKSGDDVWRSTDAGVTWEKVNDNYNGGVNPRPKGAATDSNGNIFVVDGNADVWMSDDAGANWTKINDDYNGSRNNYAGDYVIGNDIHYIVMDVGGASYVYKSTDGGYNFVDMGKITQYGVAGALAFTEGSVYGAINYGNDAPDIHRSDDEAANWILSGEIVTPFNIIDMTSIE